MFSNILALVALWGVTAHGDATAVERTIQFSGYNWVVKDSRDNRVGPGPNFFGKSPKSVWVDGQGMLHLKVTKQGNNWVCAEIVSKKSFGYGRYSFKVEAVNNLEPSVVFGLFTYDYSDPAFAHREIDFEYSYWNNPKSDNFQNVIQPYQQKGRIFRYTVPLARTKHVFVWSKQIISFESYDLSADPPIKIKSWQFKGPNIPKPGREQVRFNLWLFNGKLDPAPAEMPEVIVSNFTFNK